MLEKPSADITHSETAERRRYLLSRQFVDPTTLTSFAYGWSSGLTTDELQLAYLIADGKPNKTIAAAFDITYDASRAAVERLKRRMRRRSKAAIAFIVCIDKALAELAAHGLPYCTANWTGLCFPGTPKDRFASLTERERRIVHMLVQGIPSEEIAAMLVATRHGMMGELRELRNQLGGGTIRRVAALYAQKVVLNAANHTTDKTLDPCRDPPP